MFDKVLVANRGEIAVRVMRACKDLDVETVAVYSEADKHAGHVRFADEAYNIGPARAADSYLDHEAVIDAAEKAGADAIHPGYGFLAENADFAKKVEDTEGITWIGPDSSSMQLLGEKTSARQVMSEAGVPIVPGTTNPITDPSEVRAFADEYGYPVAIKAEGGGGGRGMKIVEEVDEIETQVEAAKREGEAYFDNDSIYLERYLESPRHIEVQILADKQGNVRHLGERDCSLQRRHQKVIEEGPSPAIDDDLRERIGEAARQGVKEAEYVNAGTVEFLVEEGNFYFLEVNTRIQVEHCVTEELTDIDIVKWQLRIAAGEAIDFEQDDVSLHGHAIEFRINAERADDDFAPATGGSLQIYDPPGGIGVRIDDSLRAGDELVTDYDSMIAKLIVHGSTRKECLARSRRALEEYTIEGIPTIIPFHRYMMDDEAFVSGSHTTDYLDEVIDESELAAAYEKWGSETPISSSPEEDADVIEREFTVEVNGKRFEVSLEDRSGFETPARPQSPGPRRESSQTESETVAPADGEVVSAEMQGTILDVSVSVGDTVNAGDVLCVLEAMKMENDILAERGGTVTEITVEPGQSVDQGDPLIVLE